MPVMFSSLLSRVHPKGNRSRQRFRPQLELLEQRLAPAAFAVDDDRIQDPNADFTSIQQAVDAAHAGDLIRVLAGTYNESVTVATGKDGLRILGARHGQNAAARITETACRTAPRKRS